MGADTDKPLNLEAILDKLEDESQGNQAFRVDDVFAAFNTRLFGPMMLVPALIIVTPAGAIPTVPSLCALIVLLTAGQRLFGREKPWLPSFIMDRGVNRERMVKGFGKFRPVARFIDKLIKPRLHALVSKPMEVVIAGFAVVLPLMTPPMELIPLAAIIPGFAMLCLGLALTAKDGVLALLGMLFTGGCAFTLVYWFFLR